MNETFFRVATALTFASAFGISVYFRTRAEMKGGNLRRSVMQRPVAVLRFGGLAILAPMFVYIFNPDWVAWARFEAPTSLRFIAVGVSAVNTGLMLWTFCSLGTNVSPSEEARESAALITTGPYRWIRHPLYTFGMIAIMALTFMTGMWWIGILGLPLISFFILWRVPREEANLIEVFGDAYRDYMRRTGRFLPKLSA